MEKYVPLVERIEQAHTELARDILAGAHFYIHKRKMEITQKIEDIMHDDVGQFLSDELVRKYNDYQKVEEIIERHFQDNFDEDLVKGRSPWCMSLDWYDASSEGQKLKIRTA
jgi:hypothetical protein